jgi:hypothetical protein
MHVVIRSRDLLYWERIVGCGSSGIGVLFDMCVIGGPGSAF